MGSLTLSTTGCVSSPPIIASDTGCSAIVPASLRKPVEGAPAPAPVKVGRDPLEFELSDFEQLDRQIEVLTNALRDTAKFGVAQTGQLIKSNTEKTAVIAIIEGCEARDRAAIEAAKPKFLGLF